MEYKEFISKLYIKGAGTIKAKFTKELFLSAVNDISVITDKRNSDSSYKGYNRGNPINDIAYDVINALNQSGIESFVKEYLNNMHDKKSDNSQKICDRFKDVITDITPENIHEKIAVFFIDEVLKPAAKEYTKVKTNIKTTSNENVPYHIQETKNTESFTDNHNEENSVNVTNIRTINIDKTIVSSTTYNTALINDNSITSLKNATELASLKALINEINSRFIDLDEKGSKLHWLSWHRSKEEQNKKEQEFEVLKTEFIDEHRKLRLYYLSFPKLKDAFEKLISLSNSMTFWYGYEHNNSHLKPKRDYQIDEYQECITAVWKALSQ